MCWNMRENNEIIIICRCSILFYFRLNFNTGANDFTKILGLIYRHFTNAINYPRLQNKCNFWVFFLIVRSCIFICLILNLLCMGLFILLWLFFSAMVPIAKNESPREKCCQSNTEFKQLWQWEPGNLDTQHSYHGFVKSSSNTKEWSGGRQQLSEKCKKVLLIWRLSEKMH